MYKRSPVTVVGLILTAICFGLYVSGSEFIQAVSNYSYDAFLRSVTKPPQSGRIVIVDIDDSSLNEIGQWPWSRHVVARLTTNIIAAGASVIAFDVVFPERDRTSPSIIREDLRRHFDLDVRMQGVPGNLEDYDMVLAKALVSGRCILGCLMHQSDNPVRDGETTPDPDYRSYLSLLGRGDITSKLLHAKAVTMSIPVLSHVAGKGFFNAVPDSDGIVRSNPLIWMLGSRRIYPSLALEAVRMDRNVSRCLVDYDDTGVTTIRIPPGSKGGEQLVLPTDQAGRLVVNYRTATRNEVSGFNSSFPTISAKDIVAGRDFGDALRDKIVFVGTSAVGLKDIKATPLSQYLSGVEVHATMADNIIAGDILSNPSWMIMVNSASILLLGIALTFLISRTRAWVSFTVTAGAVFLLIQACYLLFRNYQLIFIPAWTILSIVALYLVLTMLMFWQEELSRKQVREMFSTMVSRDVLQFLENNPDSFSLSGRKVDATMLFSDVANFATISEALPPEKLSELLNRYFTPMTHLIMKRTGYLDKYEGDMIMAVWGVPFPSEDHAVQACLSAVEQQEELAQLRPVLIKDFGHDIHVRIGVNTGPATAGNMGSDRKMQYTVMGEAVNLASRLQTINKDYGTSIIIGEATYHLAMGEVDTRLLDTVVVKGTTKPIRVYEVIARKGKAPAAKMELAALYERAILLHLERRWNDALHCLDGSLNVDFRDIPSLILRDRIIRYRNIPPPDKWTGELWIPP